MPERPVAGPTFTEFLRGRGAMGWCQETRQTFLALADTVAEERQRRPRAQFGIEPGLLRLTDAGGRLMFTLNSDNAAGLSHEPTNAIYLAPEQVLDAGGGEPADVYSLAKILVEMVTGRPPVMVRARELPGEIRSPIMKALSVQAANRYPSVRAFRDAIANAPVPEHTVSQPSSPAGLEMKAGEQLAANAISPLSTAPAKEEMTASNAAEMRRACAEAWEYYTARRYQEAIAAAERVLAVRPDHQRALVVKTQAEKSCAEIARLQVEAARLAQGGHFRAAAQCWLQLAALLPDPTPPLEEAHILRQRWRTRLIQLATLATLSALSLAAATLAIWFIRHR